MLSIIICSVSPEKLKDTKENFSDTIGDTEYEIIAYDNRTEKYPIAKVYNICGSRAAGENLFFVHEDVRFMEQGWGKKIEAKLKEPDCGVIGFAGSIIKPKIYSGWSCGFEYEVSHYHYLIDGKEKISSVNITAEEQFKEIVTVDGLGMFVRKDVFEQFPFDERILTGFHCYDLDFSMQIARSNKYRNWCCYCEVLHLSNGNFDNCWMDSTIRIHKEKWNKFLPIYIQGRSFSSSEIRKLTEKMSWIIFKDAYRSQSPFKWEIFKAFCQLPPSLWHTRKVMSGLWKFITNKQPK